MLPGRVVWSLCLVAGDCARNESRLSPRASKLFECFWDVLIDENHIFQQKKIVGRVICISIFNNQRIPENGGDSRQDDVESVHCPEKLVGKTVALMKRLLIDAQDKLRRMIDENKQLVSRIDVGETSNAPEEDIDGKNEIVEGRKGMGKQVGGKPDGEIGETSKDPEESANSSGNNNLTGIQQEPGDVGNEDVAGKSKATNPFAENLFESKPETQKGIEYFNGRSTESATNFLSGTLGVLNASIKKPKNNLSKDSDVRENSISNKLMKQGSLDSAGVNRAIKPEDFVVTSNLKLNFLTSKPAETTETCQKSDPDKNTGAVPKRSKSSASDSFPTAAKGNLNTMNNGKRSSDPDKRNKTKSIDHFVRPQSPLPCNQDEETGKLGHKKSTSWEGNQMTTLSKLKLENEKLHREIDSLKSQLSKKKKKSCTNRSSTVDVTDSLSEDDSTSTQSKLQELEEEVMQTREALTALKLDRKRLKNEKMDLLNQMKQLYGTLEDKEKELRDFIRNYEQRIRESESSLQQLSTEREERERERWSLLRHARDEAERSLSLAAQLAAKDAHIQQLQENLDEARKQISGSCLSDQESLTSMSITRINGSTGGMTPTSTPQVPLGLGLLPGDRGSCSADSGVRGSSDRESGGATSGGGTPTLTQEQNQMSARPDMDSVSLSSSVNPSHVYQTVSTLKDCSPSLSPLNATSFSRSIDNSTLSRSVEQLSTPMEEPRRKSHHSRLTGRGGAWGSISRVFTRNRHRKMSSPSSQEENYRSWSPLTEEGYAEKLRLLREAATIPMERWRAPTVLAWLEIALGMPQYGSRCAENIKSGKVLLELSDLELEYGLGVTHPMHRKKLRLAIEEHRHPTLIRYPCIAQLGHTWVSNEWLPDLGLAQYSENFATNMVDARMLDHLSKKELEKFLAVTRKFHQASIVHGIHLLRMMKYDRQALAVRRHQCDSVDADPLVWTNQRFIKWARNIDLCEYSDNLKDSGVHGALVVLEPSFNGDTMATALGIPPSKNIIRKHLAAELEALILPARYVIFCQMEEYQAEVTRAVNNVKHIQR